MVSSMVTRSRVWLAAWLMLAACDAGFEKPSIVLDLRVLALRSDPAEVVVDVDPANLGSTQLPPVTVTALLADPQGPRPLAYTLTACPVNTDTLRCDDPTQPRRVFADATTADTGADPPSGSLQVDVDLLRAALDADRFHGLGGVPVQIELAVRPAGAAADATVYASKPVTYAPRVPAGRTANQNPTFAELDADGAAWAAGAPLAVAPHQELLLLPIEPDGVRETYVVPTLDGGERTFTENLRYSWFAEDGDFSDERTGGPVDIFGNHPLLRTRWTAPPRAGPVRLWVVQRDERGGTSWTERSIVVQGAAPAARASD
jgi:hypothetical protein